MCVLFPLSHDNGFTGNKVPGRESCLSHVHLQWRDTFSSLRINWADMSDVDEEMDKSAGSDEELEDQLSPDDQLIHKSSKGQSKENSGMKEYWWIYAEFWSPPPSFSLSASAVAAAGEIVEGKRTKKTVERLDFQAPKQKEKLKIGDGKSWNVQTYRDIFNTSFPFRHRRKVRRHSSHQLPDR